MGPDDLNGFERLRHTRGPWRWVATLGLLVMLAGLATFGFAILSVVTSMSSTPGGIPQVPILMPIGFGVGLVGAVMYSLGLAFGVPQDSDFGRPNIHIEGPRFQSGGPMTIHGPVATVSITQHNERVMYVNQLGRALLETDLPLEDVPEAEQAFEELQDAVETDQPPEVIANPLARLASILKDAAAVAGGATAAIEAVKEVARVIGPVGQTILTFLR